MMGQERDVGVMGPLGERPGQMAMVDGIGKGKVDLLGHVNGILRQAGLQAISKQDLEKEVRWLVKRGIAIKAAERLALTERGTKAWAILRYGSKWREKIRDGHHEG